MAENQIVAMKDGEPTECSCHRRFANALFWLTNEIWDSVKSDVEGWVCVECVEDTLGRQLTLEDLAIEMYDHTMRRSGQNRSAFKKSLVDLTVGAGEYCGRKDYPTGYDLPHFGPRQEVYYELGEKLAAQTQGDIQLVLDRTIKKIIECYFK